jgi:ABC-type sugar transport system ATPase subunit
MRHISKSFQGVQALKDVSFNAKKGTVNVLVGENGAGKSTLMKILAGALQKDLGNIFIEGKPVEMKSPKDAIKNHVAMIYQELNLVTEMTVEENIFLGREITANGFLKKRELQKKTRELMGLYDIHLSPSARVEDLSVANQQMLEIIKALSQDAKILIMDEPTSSLSLPEVERLFSIIKMLNEQGITIIYISHRMEEIFEIGTYITVLRDGERVGEWALDNVTRNDIIQAMVGREISQIFPKEPVDIGEVILQVNGLGKKGMFTDIEFELRRGEILGISGLVGAGRTELAMTIFGAYLPDAGTIMLHSNEVKINSPSTAIAKGIAYLPEDRKKLGVELEAKISENIAITNMDKIAPKGFLNFSKERKIANDMIQKLKIKTPSIFQEVKNLSGGNQQKISLAKWLSRDLTVLILDEPTRGVDISSKEEIHRLIVKLAIQGLGIILISSELPEILGMSDRILVMHEGKQKVIINAKDATQETIMAASIGS